MKQKGGFIRKTSVNIKNYIIALFLLSTIISVTGCIELQKLQDKATGVASENIEDITAGLNIKTMEAMVGNDGKISSLYLRVTTQAGSSSVNLSEVIIHISDGKDLFDLFYEPDNNVKKGFNVKPLIDSGVKFSPEKPLIEKGDLASITIDTAQNGIDLGSGDILQISFESAKGNKAHPMEIDLGTLNFGSNKIY